jgi:hypothetical protein
MPPLSELQAGLRHAIRTGDARPALTVIDGRGLPAQVRLQIHRNHHYVSLSATLAATYPVVERLLGDHCFGGLAREFILLAPPASPRLVEYGASFPSYLAAVPTLMGLPYLPDVARLEWAINEARHAPDCPRLPAEALAHLQDSCFSDVVFTLQASCRLLASPYPVDRIWRANQPDTDPAAEITLDQCGTRLLVHRDGDDDAVWCRLSVGEFAFLAALAEGLSLGRAWNRAAAAEAAFDGSRTLSGLLQAGVFADFRFPATPASR